MRIFRYLPFLIAVLVFFAVSNVVNKNTTPQVLGAKDAVIKNEITYKTTSSFAQKNYEENITIPFEITYKNDPDIEYGEEEILEEGANGNKKIIYLITYWFDEELYRDVADTQTIPAKSQIISKGTKIVWRTISFDDVGKIKYWRKMRVFATKYDGNCYGCRGLTYSGTLVRKGVCAVDPKVISLGTNFYVEGYGMCRSEDIGGLIKGNRIDLGYEDVTKGEWRTGYTEIYLMTSAPEE